MHEVRASRRGGQPGMASRPTALLRHPLRKLEKSLPEIGRATSRTSPGLGDLRAPVFGQGAEPHSSLGARAPARSRSGSLSLSLRVFVSVRIITQPHRLEGAAHQQRTEGACRCRQDPLRLDPPLVRGKGGRTTTPPLRQLFSQTSEFFSLTRLRISGRGPPTAQAPATRSIPLQPIACKAP